MEDCFVWLSRFGPTGIKFTPSSIYHSGIQLTVFVSEDAFRLPVPEKAQKQTMFILLPGSGNGLREPLPQDDGPNPEPAMFTILDNLKVQATALVMDVELKRTIETDEKFKNHDEYFVNGRRLEGMLDLWITRHTGMRKGLVEPSEDEFTSAVPESHRKGEKAYHVKAFRGTKDGKPNHITPY